MGYEYTELIAWAKEFNPCPPIENPEYHRLQVERWLWDSRDRMAPPVVDIGAEWRRPWADMVCLNAARMNGLPDVLGTVTRLPLRDGGAGTVVCTETLEHVPNLFRAVAEIKRVLRPGGWAFVTAPFIWPTHDTGYYGDYWRIAPQGWRFLFADFESVSVTPTEMHRQSRGLWRHLAEWEVMGSGYECAAPTGLCVAARKPHRVPPAAPGGPTAAPEAASHIYYPLPK